MLELKKITKVYKTEGFNQKALDGVSVNFRQCEFAAILGPSGSGKTTFLNIIGGLDHYTTGDLVINEISTKKFKDSDWDSYRNHRIGFVFQSYNLISHQTILANVRLALTLSGISKKDAIKRAKKALNDVGLHNHMYKKPNQLSGGQMQRVAIARALVNDPDILLADEPTGALDSETSIQIMELLKNISKNKLVIMVTHNPELAQKYANRIINIKDGTITHDSNPYDGLVDTKNEIDVQTKKSKKTKMSFLTALTLSFNNLMTKKGRTILVSFAGSIGIIGIALILAVSTGFQNYVDSIQEDTLTSYPLAIMQESTDITGVLLSMQSSNGNGSSDGKVLEQQYLTNMLSNVKANDLKSFNKYLKDNYNDVENDLATVKNSYSVDLNIYSYNNKKLMKLNPSNLFNTMYGSNSAMSSYSSFASAYSQMIDNKDILNNQYDILAGKWPEKYDEMVVVLPAKGEISDLLVYSLGLRDNDELTDMVTSIFNGKKVDINNTPMSFTYEDLLNIELRLIMAADTYKYNTKYDVYEDMSTDDDFMKALYDKALKLKIVGVVTAKEGISASSLSPGVSYTKDLVEYVINYGKNTEMVKKQLANKEKDIISGKKFDSKKNNYNFEFADLVSVDNKKLESAFNFNVDKNKIANMTKDYLNDITNFISVDVTASQKDFDNTFKEMIDEVFSNINGNISSNEIDLIASNYLSSEIGSKHISVLSKKYVIPESIFNSTYKGLLTSFLDSYVKAYNVFDSSLTTDSNNLVAMVNNDIKDNVYNEFINNLVYRNLSQKLANSMTEAVMKTNVATKVGALTSSLIGTIASEFKVDENAIASAFQLKFTEDELARVVSSMMVDNKATFNSNLIKIGYQDLDEPTMISFYFTSFEGKDNFLKFIEKYNNLMESNNSQDKVINYSDTTGILMGSVKTIVNAVSYVLIAFVSISLIVSSIMIGIITYISVYERTKEIGILRSIGASKHNISSIFNAETFIIGLLSGLFGIGVTYTLIPIINAILHHFIGNIPLRAALAVKSALILILISIILTIIGGLIPARKASKKDPVEALRSE